MGIGLTFDEFVDLRLTPRAGADPAFQEAAEQEREAMFPMAAPLERLGTIMFHKASPNEHLSLAKHLTAETKTEEFVAGKGVVVKWERVRRTNHWLDALGYACAAASFAGVRLIDEARPQREPAPPPKSRESRPFSLQRPHGGPWIDFDRWGEMSRRYFG